MGILIGDVDPDTLKSGCMNPGNKIFQVLVRTLQVEIVKSREDNEIRWRDHRICASLILVKYIEGEVDMKELEPSCCGKGSGVA